MGLYSKWGGGVARAREQSLENMYVELGTRCEAVDLALRCKRLFVFEARGRGGTVGATGIEKQTTLSIQLCPGEA